MINHEESSQNTFHEPEHPGSSGPLAIRIWHVYDKPIPAGYRVLVERLWPRGQRKTDLSLVNWARNLAPSTALRQWFHHDPALWEEFRQRYLAELQDRVPEAQALLTAAAGQDLVLLYAAHDQQHNGALVLADFLRGLVQESHDQQHRATKLGN
ncbi:DUF488 domain-containing protein [Acidithiobacillus caldus]|uniref:Uroporphyrin-III c-methyltransferase n=1 Tax=Acidithiobacillus caldus (strain ATCC 51756 / DSM 8584 / KU) TaxID=637389 RepID=A0A059ZVZ0_ACICK|nr:DUF488 family protein [Acidithiobacillus caldus]AIA55623.1 protein of unknown function YeaO [Acidithiobacillus caldus ATCC 51756]